MLDFAIALSGAIGAGKTRLAEHLAVPLDADRVSFKQAVKDYASQQGYSDPDRAMLQQLGQAMVVSGREDFVARVLAQRPDKGLRKPRLIVEGVRHIEILLELRRQLEDEGYVHLIHVSTPGSTRQERVMERDGVERRVAARYDNDITEAQVQRILPQYAALIVNGELPTALQVSQVMQKSKEWARTALSPAA